MKTHRIPHRYFLIVALLMVWACEASAQTTVYWKKDYITDGSGATIVIATPAATADTAAPTKPDGLSATGTTTTTIALSWSGSTDNIAVVGYLVYRGAIPVAAVDTTTFTDAGLVPYTAYTYRIVAFDKAHNYSPASTALNTATYAVSDAPVSLTATTMSSSQVDLHWSAPGSGSPHHYGIWTYSSGTWSKFDTTTSTSYSHTGRSSNTAYLYKVSAENSSNVVLAYSNKDFATTTVFTDGTLTAHSTLIKAVHVTELRTAVNAVRSLAGLTSFSWTNSSISGAWIKSVDVYDLRSGLGEALGALGLSAFSYTNSTLTGGITVSKTHIEELRQAVKGK